MNKDGNNSVLKIERKSSSGYIKEDEEKLANITNKPIDLLSLALSLIYR